MPFPKVLWIVLALGSVASSQPATSQPAPQSDADLIGLWGSETSFGPQVRGALTLERTGSSARGQQEWTLRVGGFEVAVPQQGDTVRIALPGGQGELRAHLEDGGRLVRGFWIQPKANLGWYATPVALERVRPDAWRGTLEPLEDRLSLYLRIARSEDGSLRGSFHNPEVNWNGRASWFRVVRDEESIHLIDPTSGKTRFVQPYDASQRQIAMDFGAPIALTPRTPDQAVGYAPRSASATPYRYRVPLAGDDGWQPQHAREAGMDEELLRELVQRILTIDPSSAGTPRIHSLVIARRGKLVLDEYFFGFTPERVHDLRSASKTFTSIMLGVAMARNPELKVDSPVDPFFGRDPSARGHAPITLAHLLTHSSGLACDDNDEKSPGNEEVMQGQEQQSDWNRYFLDLPSVSAPGTKSVYCSGGINLAAGVVAKSSGMWLPDFFDRFIARPLEIRRYHMNLMPNGEAYGGGGVYMLPRDLLKIGQMYLNDGVWKGTRVVSSEWVKTSTAHQMKTGDSGSDGFAFHRNLLRVAGRDYQEYEANGNGGQFLIVVPELELVIVFTAGNYNNYGVWRTFREELVPRYILSAVRAHAGAVEALTPSGVSKRKS